MKWNSQLSLNISKGILGDFFLSVDGLLRGGMRISCVFILLLWGMCSFSVEAAEVQTINPGEIHALSAALMDGDTKRTLYAKEGDAKRANASTTKIMTCILALEQCNGDEVVEVSEYAASMPNVQLGMEPGEHYYLKDLLYSLMLESHNDSAVAIAEHVAGSVEQFSAQMNQKAAELGCSNTYFITPNGLDATDETSSHGTTAEDLARIMAYCAWDSPVSEQFLAITQTPSHSFTNLILQEDGSYVSGAHAASCANHNSYLSKNAACISGKTGFTSDAGYCYVSAFESAGRKFTIALLASGWPNNKNYKWQDCDRIYAYADANYKMRTAPDVMGHMKPVALLEAANPSFDLAEQMQVTPYPLEAPGQFLMADWETLTIKVALPRTISVERAGESSIGQVSMAIDEQTVYSSDVALQIPVGTRTKTWYFQAVCKKWMMDFPKETVAFGIF